MKTVLLILGLLAAMVVCGCEDVVQVELNSTEPRLVIEGYLSNYPGDCYFRISRTTDYYEPNIMERVNGALVIVADDQGRMDTLMASGVDGVYWYYRRPVIRAERTYEATVVVDGRTYRASTTMAGLIPIDSIQFEYQPGGGFGTEEKEGYRLHVYFQDRPDESDYVRFKLQRIIGNQELTYSDYYLYDGRFSDGNAIDYDYFLSVFQPSYTIEVELITMDKAMYYYFLTLSEVAATEEGNFLDVTPANPNTNWSGGALGYFGAFNSSYAYKVVEPE